MERETHRCKLCLKSFPNGRALGGHMRSHVMNLDGDDQIGEEIELPSSSSWSEKEENGLLGYGLRENPKRSIRVVDPEFSFAREAASVLVQDGESETESSKNPVLRRSKRVRKSGPPQPQNYQYTQKPKSDRPGKPEHPEVEPASSASGTTTEEDVAYCLMMLSRDTWMADSEDEEDQEAEEAEDIGAGEDDRSDDSDEFSRHSKNRVRGRYKCETCDKHFKSYQALGGHRASHKKSRVAVAAVKPLESAPARNAGSAEEKIHECPYCFRVFASGQALGGHKRSHVTGAGAGTAPRARPLAKIVEHLIDLNLPAPVDDEDFSQISDAEFVKSLRQ
ncbi:hypothetical protein NMG60_11029170 [Bertholletia excelsa]